MYLISWITPLTLGRLRVTVSYLIHYLTRYDVHGMHALYLPFRHYPDSLCNTKGCSQQLCQPMNFSQLGRWDALEPWLYSTHQRAVESTSGGRLDNAWIMFLALQPFLRNNNQLVSPAAVVLRPNTALTAII